MMMMVSPEVILVMFRKKSKEITYVVTGDFKLRGMLES